MNNSRKIAKNALAMTIGSVLVALINLAVMAYAARALNLEEYGRYTLAISFAAIFSVVTDLGINAILVREISRRKEMANELLGNAISLKALAGALAVVACVAASYLSSSMETFPVVAVVALTLLAGGIANAIQALPLAHARLDYFSLISLVTAVSTGILFILAGSNSNAFWFAWAYLGASIVGLAVTVIISRKFASPELTADLQVWKRLLRQGIPIALSTVFVMAYTRFNIVVLSWIKGEAAVGAYYPAYTLVFYSTILPNALATSVLPTIAPLFNNAKKFAKSAEKWLKLVLIAMLPVALGFFAFSKMLVIAVFGAAYTASIAPLSILAFMLIPLSLNIMITTILLSSDRQGTAMKIVGVMALLSLPLNVALIPRFGPAGAAVAALLVETAGAIGGLYALSAKAQMNLGFLATVLLSGTLMFVVVAALQDFGAPFAFVAGCAGYGAALLLTEAIGAEELKFAREITNKPVKQDGRI